MIREYRVTFPDRYPAGRKDPTARQGYYVVACSRNCAVAAVRADDLPRSDSERFDVEATDTVHACCWTCGGDQ